MQDNEIHRIYTNVVRYFTDTEGMVLKVEYTFGYLKDETGALKIWLQHSSLPYRDPAAT